MHIWKKVIPFKIPASVKVVIEYMDKGSLRDLVTKIKEKRVVLNEKFLAFIAVQILNGLSYLHIVAKQAHLDIKPENILLNNKGELKLTDFGISRDFNNSQEFMNTFVGTMAYMSPERMSVRRKNDRNFRVKNITI